MSVTPTRCYRFLLQNLLKYCEALQNGQIALFLKKEKMKVNKKILLLPAGLIIIAAGQISAHYIQMPDFVLGSLMGVGIGVMVLSLIKNGHSTPA